jgi:hypothetical protein
MKRGARHARSDAYDVARGENTPQHIITCQRAVVKGNIPQGVSGGGRGSGGASGASAAATTAWHASEASTAGHAWGNEHK